MIFKRSMRIVSLFAFATLSSSFLGHLVSANSTGAGTCNVEEMPLKGHGPSLQGAGGYSLTATPTGGGNFKIAVTGKTSIKGILLYTMDSTNNRLGTFSGLTNLQAKDCGGTGKPTITHTSPELKKMPLTVDWSSGGVTSGKITVRAIVVQSYSSWYNVPDLSFDLASTGPSGSPANATSATDSTTPPEENQFFIVAFFTNYTLFAIIMSISTFLYILSAAVEALLKRQQTKARTYAKSVNGFAEK